MYKLIKKIEDIVFAISILVFFGPILLLIILISFFVQGWPIFYISKRMVGLNKEINIIKFRTMVTDAKSEKYGLEKKYMKDGYLDIPLKAELFKFCFFI